MLIVVFYLTQDLYNLHRWKKLYNVALKSSFLFYCTINLFFSSQIPKYKPTHSYEKIIQFFIKKIALFFIITPLLLNAQNVGIGTNNPASSAKLDITSSNSGLLIPRISLSDVSTGNPITAPEDGLLIYNTNVSVTGGNGTGFYYWNGTIWERLSSYEPTGLEKITEGTTSGWRFIGSNPANYGDIGDNAVDLSISPFVSATRGATGDFSTAMGRSTTASGFSSTAMGYATKASGQHSTAMGSGPTASGPRSTAMGSLTTASGFSSTAMGSNTTASGNYSTAMGINTTASGNYSTAMGETTTASGYASTAMGVYTTAPSFAEAAVGLFSTTYTPAGITTWNTADRLFVVGNGTGAGARSNALTITKDGTMNINDAYDMPNTDGAANEVLTTDGFGTASWAAPADDGDWVVSGNNMYNSTSGNVGVGDATPDGKLEVRQTTTSDIFNLYDNNTNIFTVQDGGNVGIGSGNTNSARLFVDAGSNVTYNQRMSFSKTGTGSMYGVYNNVARTSSGGLTYGMYNRVTNDGGSSATDGYYTQVDGTSTGTKYGVRSYAYTGNGTRWAAYFVGNSYVSSGTWTASDERYKKDIQTFDGALNKISQLSVKSYYFKTEDYPTLGFSDRRQYGVMAQNLETVFPSMVLESEHEIIGDDGPSDSNPTVSLKTVNYDQLIPVVIKGIQEQQEVIDNQQEKIKKLEEKLVKSTQEQQAVIINQKEQNKSMEVQMHAMKKMMELQQEQIDKLVDLINKDK